MTATGRRLDLLAAAAVTAVAVLERLGTPEDFTAAVPLDLAAAVAIGACLALRGRVPRAAVWAYLAVHVAQSTLLSAPMTFRIEFVPFLLLTYSAGRHLRDRELLAWPLLYVASLEIAVSRTPGAVDADYWFFPAIALAAVVTGRAVANRARLVDQLERTTRQLDDRREAAARRAVADERRRIAHELHDVVAHAISVMVVQAGGGRRILATDAERARDAAAEVERTGREALLEMRRLLAVLRDPDRPAEREPNPTLDGLPALIERLRAGGLDVALEITGVPRPVTAGLGLGAYRVVQDALEDVARHAPAARTAVHVHWGEEAIELTVADDRPFAPEEPEDDPALLGVRERVAVYGGVVTTTTDAGGHHVLAARLPLDPTLTTLAQPTGGVA